MRNTKKFTIVFLCLCLFIYLVGALLTGTFNASQWDIGGKIFFVIFLGVAFFASGAIASE